MKIKTLLNLILWSALWSQTSLAAGGHGAHDGIPTTTIMYQTLNMSVLLIALVYFLKKPAAKFFLEKKEQYLLAAERSMAAQKAAEEAHLEIKIKLTKLESTADESVARARAEAADLKKSLVLEAQSISKRIKEEAESAAFNEVQKAKADLRRQLIEDSFGAAKADLGGKINQEEHLRLQGEFISHIQGV